VEVGRGRGTREEEAEEIMWSGGANDFLDACHLEEAEDRIVGSPGGTTAFSFPYLLFCWMREPMFHCPCREEHEMPIMFH
jgi:hypothetical protein